MYFSSLYFNELCTRMVYIENPLKCMFQREYYCIDLLSFFGFIGEMLRKKFWMS